jgi:excisionase family DNA binding protein
MTEYLSIKDVAKLLRVSTWTVRRWAAEGRITPVRIAHTIRFNKTRLLNDIDKYANGAQEREDPSLG